MFCRRASERTYKLKKEIGLSRRKDERAQSNQRKEAISQKNHTWDPVNLPNIKKKK